MDKVRMLYSQPFIISLLTSKNFVLSSIGLLGQIYVTQEKNEVSKVLEEGSPDFIDWFGPDIRPGGAWKPENCKARQKVVLLVRSTPPHL